jgi:threonine/homoserine/homoserine lactone efflux protein
MTESKVLVFAWVAMLLTMTPGVDTMLVIRNVVARGRRHGFMTLLGINSGCLVHATLSIMGISMFLVRSAQLFNAVKLAGAVYLIYLGLGSFVTLVRERRGVGDVAMQPVKKVKQCGMWQSYFQGFTTNILNPKVSVFYLAFLPQFITLGQPVAPQAYLLGGIHIGEALVWLSLVTLFVGQMRAVFSRSGVRQAFEAVTGTVLIGLGLKLAVAKV